MLDLERLEAKLAAIIKTPQWQALQKSFNSCDQILLIGHGGNLPILQHCATQINRYTGKYAVAPDANYVSIWHGDGNYRFWLDDWVKKVLDIQHNDDSKRIVVGFSSSGKSDDVMQGLIGARDMFAPTFLVSAREPQSDVDEAITQVLLDLNHYYTSETAFMLLLYELIRGLKGEVEVIKSIPSIDSSKITPRAHSVKDEQENLSIDFDGVVHKCSKGFFNGTIYDEPIEGALETVKKLSEKYTIIMHTAKAKPDRPLVDGRTGTELVWEWLEKYNIAQYVKEVTSEKPRAVAYIDDKAIRFSSWEQVLKDLGET